MLAVPLGFTCVQLLHARACVHVSTAPGYDRGVITLTDVAVRRLQKESGFKISTRYRIQFESRLGSQPCLLRNSARVLLTQSGPAIPATLRRMLRIL
jgi:hypothetical protein